MNNSIRQEIKINVAPSKVYNALLDADQFSKLSGGAPANIDRNEGGAFTIFGDYVTGKQIELVPDKRVVQAWRAKSWPEGVHSMIRFELEPDGDGTKLIFEQHGHPADQQEHLEQGWHDNYWNPMNDAL